MSHNTEPTARFWHCGCLVEGKWLIYGGRYEPDEGLAEPASVLHQFDPNSKNWKKIEASGMPPQAIYSIATASIRHYLYSFGGSDSPDREARYYNTLHRLDTRTKVWTKLTPKNPENSPMPKRGAVMIAYGHLLVIFGGLCYLPPDIVKQLPESKLTRIGWTNELVCYDTREGEYGTQD